ncbi:transporter [Paramyrothecium foliicola]|nr:transporter [Paramyrothecium foliicola]
MSGLFSNSATRADTQRDVPSSSSSEESEDGQEKRVVGVTALDPAVDDKTLPAARAAEPINDPLALGLPPPARKHWWQLIPKPADGEAIATQESVFDDAELAKRYQPRADWENIHRFDPSVRWTYNEENKLIRKIDLRIMFFACVMFIALELDRSNLSQAVSDNFLVDLHMDTDDFNLGNTVFRLSFLCAELPSQLVSKWVGPDRWIPAQLCIWSLVSAGQFWLSGRTSFLVCRCLLGMFQGGFIPDIILYLSYFYKSSELSVRLAYFWSALQVADIISGFLGAGFLQLRGWHGLAGWRWLFLFEGLLTLVVGILAWGLMPAGPTQTKHWFRGKNGWFSDREETVMVNRIIRDDPSKGDMHNRQPITPKLLLQCLSDYDLWPLYAIGLTWLIPVTPPAQYLTLTLRNLGFSVVITNLLTIPHTLLAIGTLLGLTYLSEHWNQRAFLAMLSQIWVLPFLVYVYVVDITKVNRWLAWAVLSLLLAYPSPHAIQVSWNSRNSNTVRLRTVSAALYNMCVQSAAIMASNVYRKHDAPRYRNGNRNLLIVAVLNICIYLFIKTYYVLRNKSREKKWSALTEEQKRDYLDNTKDSGNKRLDFRFAH